MLNKKRLQKLKRLCCLNSLVIVSVNSCKWLIVDVRGRCTCTRIHRVFCWSGVTRETNTKQIRFVSNSESPKEERRVLW